MKKLTIKRTQKSRNDQGQKEVILRFVSPSVIIFNIYNF